MSQKNNSRAVFTSHERTVARAAWGSSTARLTRDSFLPFASCCLCLEPARDPVACPHGDIFCRECALSNILAQKQEIKRQEKAREQEEREALEMKARDDAEAQKRAVKEFELVQAGFDVGSSGRRGSAADDDNDEAGRQPDSTATTTTTTTTDGKRGEKRKFALDDDELSRIAEQDRAKARRAIDDEKAAKPKLPSFWVPSVVPSSNRNAVLHEVKKKSKSNPVCPASPEDRPHNFTLHTLVAIQFTEEDEEQQRKTGGGGARSRTAPQRICPSCKKVLSNSSKAMLAKPCGHVLCKSCVNKFMQPTHDPHDPDSGLIRCYVCDADLTDRKKADKPAKGEKDKIRPGLVELRSEGTGFSASGKNEVKKNTVAFRA